MTTSLGDYVSLREWLRDKVGHGRCLTDYGINFVGVSGASGANRPRGGTTDDCKSWIYVVLESACCSYFGAVLESMIKAAKRAISVVLLNAVVTDEDIQTVFKEVQSLMNSTPLTTPSEDLNV